MELNFHFVKSPGVIADIPAVELDRPVATRAWNVEFREGKARKMLGNTAVFDPPTVAPYHLMPVRNFSTYFWIYAGLTSIYCFDGTNHTDISRTTGGAYNATAADKWSGGVLNGIAFLNNPNDVPQQWTPSASNDFTALANWDSNNKCRVLKSYKNFLVALDVTKTATRYPHLVMWSDAAEPGLVPASWTPSATNRAGEYPLAENDDFVIDGLSLRDTFVIYKQESCWGMQLIGGDNVFRFYRIFDNLGVLGVHCAIEFKRGQHAVFAPDDIVVHDGVTATSIVDNRVKSYLFNRINGDYAQRSFVAHAPKNKQLWFCYPADQAQLCTEACVWDYSQNSVTFRNLPGLAHASHGILDLSDVNDTWADASGTWADATNVWNESNFDYAKREILMAEPATPSLLSARGTTFNGSTMTAYMEKKGIALPQRLADSPPDTSSMKYATRIWPRITGSPGGTVKVYIGEHDSTDESPTYRYVGDFIIGSTQSLDPMVSGRLIAVKFESTASISWELSSFTLELKRLGAH